MHHARDIRARRCGDTALGRHIRATTPNAPKLNSLTAQTGSPQTSSPSSASPRKAA